MKKNNGYDLTTDRPMGAILSDGMGALVADPRSLLDIMIEPGAQFAPFQGLTAEQVEAALAMVGEHPTTWVGEGEA